MENLANVFSTNFDHKSFQVLDAETNSCTSMYSGVNTTYDYQYYGVFSSSTVYETGTRRSLPVCNTNNPAGTNPFGYLSFDEVFFSNGNACTVSYSQSTGTFTNSQTRQYERKFAYAYIANDSKIISFDVSVINSLRIIPFSLVVFGFDLGGFLNDFVQ